jgi:peroxiredoxin Q/BCP
MKAYQADIAKLQSAEAVVFGISVDNREANARFASEQGITFPLLSDPTKQVTTSYGVLNRYIRLASRTTFVVDRDGVIRHVQGGSEAIDPSGAVGACERLKKQSSASPG